MTRRAFLWSTAALLGIVVTAAVAWAASQLAGQRIGLSSAPLSVQRGLAPETPRHERHVPAGRPRRHAGHQPPAETHGAARASTVPGWTVTAPTTITVAPPVSASSSSAPAPPPTTSPIPNPQPVHQHDDSGSGSSPGGASGHRDD